MAYKNNESDYNQDMTYSSQPVYLLVNASNGVRLFTADANEVESLKNQGSWENKGIAFYAPSVKTSNPVYRLFNPANSDYYYTNDYSECTEMLSYGWIEEGIAFYGAMSGQQPIYRLWSPDKFQNEGLGCFFWTSDAEEYATLSNQSSPIEWRQEGVGWYADSLAAPDFTYQSQTLNLSSVKNARQLGGYVMADGRRIKDGMLIRSAALHNLSEQDSGTLTGVYNLKSVVDFRTDSAWEARRNPDIIPEGVRYHLMSSVNVKPLLDAFSKRSSKSIQTGEANRFSLTFQLAKNYGPLKGYQSAFQSEESKEAFRTLFDELLENAKSDNPGAVLWHCSQGKDRTGLASALVLTALGADEATIRRDYSLTSSAYIENITEFGPLAMEYGLTGDEIREFEAALGNSYPEYLQIALENVKNKYGSLMDYLQKEIGLTDGDLTILKDTYLE